MEKMIMENTKMKNDSMPKGSNIKDFEEKLAQVKAKNDAVLQGKYNHEQVMSALYNIFDASERTGIIFFLIGDCARACYKNLPVSTDRIEIGMRRLEKESGAWRIFTEFAKVVKEDKDEVIIEYKGMPVYCKLFDDEFFFTQPDTIIWQYEAFRIPNQYEEYVKRYERKESIQAIPNL